MSNCTIILPIDKKRNARLLELMQMFTGRQSIAVSEIISSIPSSTFNALLYKLKLLSNITRQRHGFELFSFDKTFDFNSKKELKTMKLNSAIEIVKLDGLDFVVLEHE